MKILGSTFFGVSIIIISLILPQSHPAEIGLSRHHALFHSKREPTSTKDRLVSLLRRFLEREERDITFSSGSETVHVGQDLCTEMAQQVAGVDTYHMSKSFIGKCSSNPSCTDYGYLFGCNPFSGYTMVCKAAKLQGISPGQQFKLTFGRVQSHDQVQACSKNGLTSQSIPLDPQTYNIAFKIEAYGGGAGGGSSPAQVPPQGPPPSTSSGGGGSSSAGGWDVGKVHFERKSRDCGRLSRGKGGSGRIVGGYHAKKAAFPWIALLTNEFDPSYPQRCGGSLLTPQFVVTAGHCMYDHGDEKKQAYWKNGQDWSIVLGEYDTEEEEGNEIFLRGSRIWVHPKYEKSRWGDLMYDVAIIKLPEPVDMDKHRDLNVICLPTKDYKAGKACQVAGWGRTNTGYDPILSYAKVEIVDSQDDKCPALANKDTVVCAYGAKMDACQGDSGGPLMCRSAGQYVLTGVVSSGKGCGVIGNAGIYTNVYDFTDWIEKTVRENA